jgi:competence protein ComEA
MQGFVDSFKPLFSRYKSEVILLSCALFITLTSAVLFFQQRVSGEKEIVETIKNETHTSSQKQTITIDVSGAVKNPFVYTLPNNARIIDAIQKAGGITSEADEAFVSRNVNYARIVSDQEKIYIPFLSDTSNGYVLENKRVIDYTQPNIIAHPSEESTQININTASVIELDQLPGIGKVMAEAIVNGRPYTSTDDLVTNNIIKKAVYEKIKNQVSVY